MNFIRAQFKFLQNAVVKQGSARTFREELQSELKYYESFFKIYSALKLAERKGKIQKTSFAEGEPSGWCVNFNFSLKLPVMNNKTFKCKNVMELTQTL